MLCIAITIFFFFFFCFVLFIEEIYLTILKLFIKILLLLRTGFAKNILAPCGLASLATSRLGLGRGVIGSIMTCHDALSRCDRAILRRSTDLRLWQHLVGDVRRKGPSTCIWATGLPIRRRTHPSNAYRPLCHHSCCDAVSGCRALASCVSVARVRVFCRPFLK